MFGRRGIIILTIAGAGLSAGTAAGQSESADSNAPSAPSVTPKAESGATSGSSGAGAKAVGGSAPVPANATVGDAQAAPPTPADVQARERAKQLYEQGVTAFREGRYSDAVDKLLEADRVMPNAAFSYNIALVYEQMGDERSALRWLRNYLRQSTQPTDADAATVAKVRKLESALQSQGLQQVSILSEPPGATIQLDGRALGITPFTTEITPGIHRITLMLEGYEPAQRDFELRPDRSTDVAFALVTRQQALPPATGSEAATTSAAKDIPAPILRPVPPRSAVHPVEPSSVSRIRPLTWIGLGAGALLLGGSGVVELERRRQQGVTEEAPQATYQPEYDGMETRKVAARVLLATGSAVLATGVTLLVIDLTRTSRVSSAGLGGCGTAGICAEMRGRF